MAELEKEVQALLSKGEGFDTIERELLSKGNLKEDVDAAIQSASASLKQGMKKESGNSQKKFFVKELFDRIGYGFGSEQYINIFLLQTGAPYPLIAGINGLRSIISAGYSTLLKDYSSNKGIDRRLLGASGIIFGFSFIFMAMARHLEMVWLYLLAMLIGAVGIVSYGELYQQTMAERLKGQKKGLIEGMYRFGLLITVASLVAGALIIDKMGVMVLNFVFVGQQVSLRLIGYFMAFEIAALCFIISGYALALISREKTDDAKSNTQHSIKTLLSHIGPYIANTKADISRLLSERKVVTLILLLSLIGIVQVMGNSFYGIFIYENFQHVGFGAFLNVAMVSILALITSLITPLITKESAVAYGKYPMLIFGIVLMAIMPLAFWLNPNLVSIGIATILGVMGAAIVGISTGFLTRELMPRGLSGNYYSSLALLTIAPYILLVPAISWFIAEFGLSKLFMLLCGLLILVALPMGIAMMIAATTKQKIGVNDQKKE